MEGSCVQALYDFPQDAEGDLALNVGDIIKVTGQVNDEWLFGLSKQNSGQFPASFVQTIFDKMPDAVGIAIADFQGEEEGDLCFSKGDVVGVLEEIDENWCHGCTRSSKGIFPRSFVEFIDFLSNAQDDCSKIEVDTPHLDAEVQAYGTSNEAFTAQSAEELSFPKGVRIDLLQELDSFWTLGSYKGKKGKFPTMFVNVVQELPEKLKYMVEVKRDIVSSEDETIPKAKALFLYVGTSKQDLNFDKGDIILLKEKVNEEWYKGQIGNSVGIFPASYVQVIVDLPFDKPMTTKQEPLSPRNRRKGRLDVNGMTNGHMPKSQITPQKKRPAPTVVKVKSTKEEKGPVEQVKTQPPVLKPTVAPKPPVTAARPLVRNPNSFPLNNDCITVIKPERNASRREKSTKVKTTVAPKPAVRPLPKQSKGDGLGSHVPRSSPLEKEKNMSARAVNGGINFPLGQPTVVNKPVITPRKKEQGSPRPVKEPTQDLKAKTHRSPTSKRPAPPLPASTKGSPTLTATRVMTDSGDLLSGDATSTLKLPKPLAPQPPVRPSALFLNLPPSIGSRSADSSPAVEIGHLEQPGNCKDPGQAGHFSLLQNPTLQRKALTPPPERRARPKSAYFQPGDRAQSMRKSATLTRRNTTRSSSKSGSKFFVDTTGGGKDVSPEEEGDLTSVEMKISEVQSKISAEANLLSGVETLLEVVADPTKLSELKSKQSQHLSLIQELNEELTELEDEKSYLLAKYGKPEDIMNHMVRVEQQIQMLKSEAEQLEKAEDIATFEDLAQTREDSNSCRYMISALEEELVALRERLLECQKQYTSPEESAAKQQEQRGRVVEELIRTERDYVRDVTLCVTQVIPELANCKVTHIDCQTLFSNMGDVAAVSTKLLHTLEMALQNPVEQIGTTLGQCFIDLSAELKGCYAVYCKQYDDAQALSEKYEQDLVAREEVMSAMKLIRGETLTWDLPSYLIKPVQRILKYPLLLQEFLKNTPENEQGRSVTALAINSMTDVATSINEFKRRKDLVQKYQKAEGFGDKISRLNWHSILKKSSRMNQRLTQITGINARTVDTSYNEEEKKIRGLEKLVKTLIKNLTTYVEGTQEQISLHKQNIGNIYEFCEDLSPPSQVKLFIHASQNVAAVFEKHISYIQDNVMDPLNDLLQVFQSPSRLMEKREDKLLDYDSWQKKSYRTKDKEKLKQIQEDLAKARNNYQALNSQLLEELPKLSAKCSKYVVLCLTNFIHARRCHSLEVKNLLGSLPQTAIPADSAAILSMHGEAIQIASEQLAKLTFTPEKSGTPTDNRKATNMEPVLNATGTLGRTNFYVDFSMLENELSDDPTSPISPNADGSRVLLDFDNSPVKAARDTAEHTLSILAMDQWKGVPHQDLYRAKFAFQAQDKAEITVVEGDQVRVLSRADKSGNSEWWLVESQASKGYIPSSYLEPLSGVMRQVNAEQDSLRTRKPSFSTLLDTSVHHDAPAQLPVFIAQVTSTPVGLEKQAFSSLPRPAAYQENAPNPVSFDLNRSVSTEDDLQVAEFYVAEYDFEKSNLGELNLTEGQLVRVVNKHDYHGNTEWWLVEVDGTKGYVPGNYLSFVHSVPLG